MASYQDNDPKGWCGDPKRGAALGRVAIRGELGEGETLSVVRKQLDGDYDENGTYWGGGRGTKPIFWVSSESGEIDYVIRANDIGDARAQVAATYPKAKIAGDQYNVSLDLDTLQQFLNSECESLEEEYAELNDEVKIAAREFETAVWRTLETWVSANLGLLELDGFEPDEDGFVAGAVVREMSSLRGGAGYLYYQEHEGAGVGTWDGDWDHLFKDHRVTLRVLSEVVKKATHAEYQKLHDALVTCSFEGIDSGRVPSEHDEADHLQDCEGRVITHETPAEVLVTMLGMARTIGKIQWGQLGQDAEKAAASWLGSVDRALEAAQAQNIVLAVENMKLANTIEREWPAFNMVAERVIKVLEPLQDAGALADYLKGV